MEKYNNTNVQPNSNCHCEEGQSSDEAIHKVSWIASLPLVARNDKNGFTLAEMIITTAIIGLISSLMIGTYLTSKSYYNNQYVAGLKKVYSELNYAGEQIKAGNGGTLANIQTRNDNGFASSIGQARLFCKYLKCAKICDYNNGSIPTIDKCFYNDSASANTAAILNDGTQVKFYYYDTNCAANVYGSWMTHGELCGTITVDINGSKRPDTRGRDRFMFLILKNEIVPLGATTSAEWHIDSNNYTACGLAGIPASGYTNSSGCAAIILKTGKMTY